MFKQSGFVNLQYQGKTKPIYLPLLDKFFLANKTHFELFDEAQTNKQRIKSLFTEQEALVTQVQAVSQYQILVAFNNYFL